MNYMTPFTAGLRKNAITAAVLTIIIAFTSCLKQDYEMQQDKILLIGFNQLTITYESTDSAAVIFTKQGSTTPIFKRLQKTNGTYTTSLEDLPNGSWTANIYLYTRKDNQGNSFQYAASLNFTAENISGIVMPGPDPATTLWKKHVILSTANNDVIVIIPLDMTDPHFEIRTKTAAWDSFRIDRRAFFRTGATDNPLAENTWECDVNCMGSDRIISNTTAFAPFSELMKTKNWNHGKVSAAVTDSDQQQSIEFNYEWNK